MSTIQVGHERERIASVTTSNTVIAARPGAIGGKHHFLLRRLHSLTGIVPIGLFLMFHLFTNMQMAFGTFQHEVNWIHSQPALIFMEIFVLALPIAFHALLGLAYTFIGAQPNTTHYPYWDNWRYLLQRVTGVVALFFIALHVLTLRGKLNVFGWFTPFFVHGATPAGQHIDLATASTAIAFHASWLVVLFYAVGVLCVVYHWCNGLWTAAITWGLTISVAAQRKWAYFCGVIFAGLMVFSIMAIVAAVRYTPSDVEMAAYNNEVAQLKMSCVTGETAPIVNEQPAH